MHSPFPYESFAIDESFFGRKEELKQLKKLTNNSNNCVLHSKRRMGKSSLILKHLDLQKDTIGIYIDIFDITLPKDFASLLLNGIAKAQKGDFKSVLNKLSKLFKRVKFGVEVDPSSGTIDYTPKIQEMSFEEIIGEAFEALFEIEKENRVILAIDEFQQIAQFSEKKIDAILRKYMQQNKKISYVFLGSKRDMLYELFKYQAPLYEMATQIEIGCIKNEDYYLYIQKYLQISKELIDSMIEISACETKLMQHLCHILYRDFKNRPIEQSSIYEALKEVVLSKDSSFVSLFDSFTLNKKKAFKILCLYDGNYFRQEVLTKYNITRQSLTSALNSLFKQEVIDKENDTWFIPNRSLELWGKERFR